MSADHKHVPPAAPPLNHELSDADPAPVLKFLVFLVVLTTAIAGAIVFFYNYLERREALEKTARYPMSLSGDERPLPPPPRLQVYPFDDVKDLRRTEQPLITRYEWLDKDAGTVRIPVDRAMQLLSERGLAHRAPGQPSAVPPAPAGPASGPATPTGASSGSQPITASPPPR